MSEDYGFINKNKPQINADKRRCGFDPFGSVGIGMFATEALINASGLSSLYSDVEIRDRNVKKGSEGNGSSTTECAENTEMPGNSSGLTPLRPFDEIDRINQKSPLAKDFSAIKGLETLRKSSGLTPLGFDSELLIKAQGVSPLEGICVRRAEKPQGFGLDERRYSPHRTKRSGLTDLDQKGE